MGELVRYLMKVFSSFFFCTRYAGWMGTVAARCTENGQLDAAPTLLESRHRLALVAGTSTCHLVQVCLGLDLESDGSPILL